MTDINELIENYIEDINHYGSDYSFFNDNITGGLRNSFDLIEIESNISDSSSDNEKVIANIDNHEITTDTDNEGIQKNTDNELNNIYTDIHFTYDNPQIKSEKKEKIGNLSNNKAIQKNIYVDIAQLNKEGGMQNTEDNVVQTNKETPMQDLNYTLSTDQIIDIISNIDINDD